MTFTEAALEVLRAVGEPLHYKRITELAIERNLLSHVGKSPEITMISRLATLVKTDRGQGPIVKVKPGVFAVREVGGQAASVSAAAGDDAPAGRTVPAAVAIPGADVFPAEEDDDDPILAGLDDAAAPGGGGEGDPQQEGGGGRRRRRRRRGRGGRGEAPHGGPMQGGQGGPGRPGDGGGYAREPRPVGGPGDRGPRRDFSADRGPRRDFSNDRGAPRREPDVDMSRAPDEGDLLGRDLADAAFAVMSQAERVPASFARVADLLVRRGRLSGDPVQLAPTVAAALRADAAIAAKAHTRARFRIRGTEVALTAWRLPREASRWEEDAERAAERQRAEVRRAFVARLNELPAAGFAELLASWLNAEGIASLRAVRRPGASGGAFHFAGVLRRGAHEQRLAIVVQRGNRDVDREAIIEVRGSLAHYGGATAAWLVSTGRVTSGAREELVVEGAASCVAFDGAGLAAAMERAGIGLRVYQIPLADIDFDLLEALGDSGERRDRFAPRAPERPGALAGAPGGVESGGPPDDGGGEAEAEAARDTMDFETPEASWEDANDASESDSDEEPVVSDAGEDDAS